MSTAERKPSGAGGVSMRDLLAAGAAAKVISTPPAPPVAPPVKVEGRRAVSERCPRAA